MYISQGFAERDMLNVQSMIAVALERSNEMLAASLQPQQQPSEASETEQNSGA